MRYDCAPIRLTEGFVMDNKTVGTVRTRKVSREEHDAAAKARLAEAVLQSESRLWEDSSYQPVQ